METMHSSAESPTEMQDHSMNTMDDNANKMREMDLHSLHSFEGFGHEVTFNTKLPLNLLFVEIRLQNHTDLAIACILLLFLGMLYEGLKHFRLNLVAQFNRVFSRCYRMQTSPEHHKSKMSTVDIEMEVTKTMITSEKDCESKGEISSVTVETARNERFRTILIHCLDTGLHAVQLFLSYVIMLAVMTYNVYIVVSIIAGCSISYFFLQWPSKGQKKSESHQRDIVIQTDCH